jgi:Protein of unknown function (DUF3788)
MEPHVLTNKDQFPTEEIIFSHIGKSKIFWNAFFDYIHVNHPEFEEQWRFYNDGKSWLMKVVRKKKTIFWLSIIKSAFRVTFYFNDRAEAALMNCSISDELKAGFRNGRRFGKIRALTIIFNNKKDIDYAATLIGIKLSVK